MASITQSPPATTMMDAATDAVSDPMIIVTRQDSNMVVGETAVCGCWKDHLIANHEQSKAERVESAVPLSPIVTLPEDILMFMIWRCVDFNSLLALRSTCRAMRNILPLELLTHLRADIVQSLLAAEKLQLSECLARFRCKQVTTVWGEFYIPSTWQMAQRLSMHLTCYGCLELKPLQAFIDRMSSRGTGLGARYAELRRCKDCMCRYLCIGGVWWLEHWVLESDVVRRRGRVDRWKRWLTHGDRLVKLPKDDERGVCRVCGVSDELYWGCVGCFEKEERHQRNRSWEVKGLRFAVYDNNSNGGGGHGDNKNSSSSSSSNQNDVDFNDEGTEEAELNRTHRAVKWLIETTEEWSSNNARKRRAKYIRRSRNGSWWLRALRGNLHWEGTWEGRMTALAEHLKGNDVDHSSVDHDDEQQRQQGANSKTAAVTVAREQLRHSPTNPGSWKAVDQVPLRASKREQRCSNCWEPCVFRDPLFIVSLAFAQPLPFDRWCQDCQDEQRAKISKRHRHVADLDQAVESVRLLFI